MKSKVLMTESELQEAVAGYLVTKYPDVMFHSDFGSGTKLSPKQAAMQKRQNGYRKGWPDLFVTAPQCPSGLGSRLLNGEVEGNSQPFHEAGSTPVWGTKIKHGLFLELKKDGTRLKKKNGDWATPHIAEQAKILSELGKRGYHAEFAVGFDEAVKIIDEYLGEPRQNG